jgi:flagellar biosynthetic protein FliR
MLQLCLNEFLVFALILVRIGSLVMTAPVFAPRSVPLLLRGLLAVAVSLMLAPLHWGVVYVEPHNLLELSLLLAREAGLGAALGLGVMILLAGLRWSGQLIGQMSGTSLADVLETDDVCAGPFSQLIGLVAVASFLTIGGHRQVMAALLDSFRWMPPGDAKIPPGIASALLDVTTHSFELAVRAASPVVVAVLLSTLLVGLLSRTLPQLNMLAIGFSVNSIALLATLSLSLGTMAWIFQEQAHHMIETIRAVFAISD